MGVMKLDVDALKESVVALVDKCYTNLSEANDILSSIKIPSDFGHAGSINTVKIRVKEISSSLIEIKSWISMVIKGFNMAEDNNIALTNGIENTENNTRLQILKSLIDNVGLAKAETELSMLVEMFNKNEVTYEWLEETENRRRRKIC